MLFAFASCSKQVESVDKVLLKEDLEASIYQDLKNKDSYLFQVATIDRFDCGNSFILSNSNFYKNQLDIVIEGVFVPKVCDDSSRILNTIHTFGLNQNNCAFSINVQDLYKVEGNIFKNDDSGLEVSLSEAPRILFDYYKLRHINDDYLWIGLDLDESLAGKLMDKLNTTLAPYVSNKKLIEDGHYGYFNVHNAEPKVFKDMSKQSFKYSLAVRLSHAIDSKDHPVIQALQNLFAENPELHRNTYSVKSGTGVEVI